MYAAFNMWELITISLIRIQDVESDIPEKFPVLEEKIVKLKFQPLAARTYNVLQSLIAVNAVDSRREHQVTFLFS